MPGLAAGRLDHRADQHVAGIVVVPARAGREVGRLVAEGGDQLRGRQVLHDAAAGHDRVDVGVAADARGVVEQHLHRDLVAAGIAGHELRQRIGQRQLAVLGQLQHRGGGELLGHRADAEHLSGRERHVEFEVGAAAGAAVQHLVAAREQHRHARRLRIAVVRQGPLGEAGHVGLRRRLRGGGGRQERQQQSEHREQAHRQVSREGDGFDCREHRATSSFPQNVPHVLPSSRRKPGSICRRGWTKIEGDIKMDPGFRRDDEQEARLTSRAKDGSRGRYLSISLLRVPSKYGGENGDCGPSYSGPPVVRSAASRSRCASRLARAASLRARRRLCASASTPSSQPCTCSARRLRHTPPRP